MGYDPEYSRTYLQRPDVKERRSQRRRTPEAKKQMREYRKRWCRKKTESVQQYNREYHFRTNYGIALEDLQKMKEQQAHSCLICRKRKSLHVDHDHQTGKIRGLLCRTCNQGLGSFYDTPTWLRSAALYLERSRT